MSELSDASQTRARRLAHSLHQGSGTQDCHKTKKALEALLESTDSSDLDVTEESHGATSQIMERD